MNNKAELSEVTKIRKGGDWAVDFNEIMNTF